MGIFRKVTEQECYGKTADVTLPPGGLYCGRYFDGLLCWNFTKAGTVAAQHCPMGLVKEYATLRCEENGEWYFNPERNRTWTNLTQCGIVKIDEETAAIPLDIPISVPGELLKSYETWLPIIKIINYIGYGLSAITLISAMVIFVSIKKLRCPRNKLHMHLFITFILRAVMCFLKDFLFVRGIAFQRDIVSIDGKESIKEHNFWLCKAITSVRWYITTTNYVMVLMEGIYLHNLMFLSVLSDNSRITVYYLLGWGLPLLFIIPWVILRIVYEDDLCWTTNNNSYIRFFLDIPPAASVIINFVLFVIIVRILFLKLGSMYIQQRSVRYRRLARSTLILIPLFGVPYVVSLLMGYLIPANSFLEIVWILVDQSLIAYQGFFIALIYCLFNTEVHTEIRKYYSIRRRQKFRRSRERTISTNTQCASLLPLTEDLNRQDNGDCKNSPFPQTNENGFSSSPQENGECKMSSFLPLTENCTNLNQREGKSRCTKF